MIVIIGCGTLGSRLAFDLQDLKLVLCDHDIVSKENIGVQKFSENDVGKQKAVVLADRLQNARAKTVFIDHLSLNVLEEASVVCDCTDNFVSRRLLAKFCRENGIPFVHGAAAQNRGVVAVFTTEFDFSCVYDHKVPVDACRSTDIDLDMADVLSKKQAELAISCLDEEKPFFGVVTKDGVREVAVKPCDPKPAPANKEFFMTFCTQAMCMSAKPIAKRAFDKQFFKKDGVSVEVFENGEIHFRGSEDVDVLRDIALQIYNR